MNKTIPEPLFVFEMANNHMGNVEHGIRIIRAMKEATDGLPFHFAFKLQYRDLDTFIHPAKKGRDDIKYVKRFSETRLDKMQFDRLVHEIRANGFLAMATPFDENSVDLIVEQQLDLIKIASCSFTDWPLLERIAATNLPIIASTAGASVEDMDRVVSFFSHRNKEFALLHCVGEYPTPAAHMNLSQIDFLQSRYQGVRIGFSSHENPEDLDMVKIAVAKGAVLFEKHVGVATDCYPLNEYSASPEQVRSWLMAAHNAFAICGTETRANITNHAEKKSLRSLQRGVFARRHIKAGETITTADVFFAFPPEPDQYTANDWSKYARFTATTDIPVESALCPENSTHVDQRQQVWNIVQEVKQLLKKSGITFPGRAELEISHHYGLDDFRQNGLTMLTVVNRAYCKKLLIVLPGQNHPEQFHRQKEETFHVLYGDIRLELNGISHAFGPGDVVTITPGDRHLFHSTGGAVIEEISSTHFKDDSFYTDPAIAANSNRKTMLSYWMN